MGGNPIDWWVLDVDFHRGLKQMVTDLNPALSQSDPVLHHCEFEDSKGFRMDRLSTTPNESIPGFNISIKDSDFLVVVVNTPVPRQLPHRRAASRPLHGNFNLTPTITPGAGRR